MTRVAIIGGGVTGLTAAFRLHALRSDIEISVIERDGRTGGKIRSSEFAGVPGVDEGADAFLTRVPFATQLAGDLGLGDAMTSPAVGAASVWWNGLHPIPEGLLLGVPTGILSLARSKLLTWPGKARAALEPLLPATGVGADSVGSLIRHRFGKQVHERLVDPLVGSIYAADTDHFSLAGVPQISDLASNNRSLLLGARKAQATVPPSTGPIFAAPTAGMATLTDALVRELTSSGVTIRTGAAAHTVERATHGWRVDGDVFDGVILASPAAATAPIVRSVCREASEALATFDHAGVVMITLDIAGAAWPGALRQFSGYLVPKPMQQWVTAASFATTKWPHWRPVRPDGTPGMVLRISLGRDGNDLTDHDDDDLLGAAVNEVGRHLGVDLQPDVYRITRWPKAFPQYRPGHAARVLAIESALARDAPGVIVCGASYRGIGIPACIQQANAAATSMAGLLQPVRD